MRTLSARWIAIFSATVSVSAFTQEQPGACAYVQELAGKFEMLKAVPVKGIEEFRLLHSFETSGTGDKFKVESLQNLATLPHIVWGMAQVETNIDQLPRKPIDMPTIDGFLELAKRAFEAKKLAAYKYRLLQSANSVRMNSFLRSSRAGAVIDEIQKSFPGVVSGEKGNFADSKAFNDFLAANGLQKDKLTVVDWQIFSKWALPLPMYLNGFTAERANDLAKTLQILNSSVVRTVEEQACAFLLRERFLAQMISFTGTHAAPKLTEDGRLNKDSWVNETPRGEAPYATEDKANNFGQFVDEVWITERLNGSVDLSQEFTQTAELISFLNFSKTIISLRNSNLWAVGESSPKALPLPLLQLGFGTLGVNLKNFSDNHLTVLPGARIRLKDDSNENLVAAAWAAFELSRSLSSLRNPNDVERAALSASQIHEFLGAQAKLYQLFTGTVIEALARRRASRYEIEILYRFLTTAGDRLDNDYLRNLPRKPNPPSEE